MSLLSPLLYRAALIDRQTQLLSRPWQQYFQALDTRVGGPSAPTILELAAARDSLSTALAALTLRVAALTLRVTALEAVVYAHQGTPTVAAVATGAGLGAVVSVSGRDEAGTLSLTTAAYQERRSHALLLTLTFAAAYTTPPAIVLQPANAAAAALAPGTVRVLRSDTATTGFSLRTGTPRLPRDGAVFQFTYEVR